MENKKLIIGVFIAGLMGCGKPGVSITGDERFHEYPTELTTTEFADWKKNETQLTSRKETNEITFKICYQPAEWLALKSLGNGASADAIANEAANYEELLYFTLRLQLKTAQTELLKFKSESDEDYSKRVEYYSFKVQKDIALVVDSKDTLPCSISHFERAYNVTNYSDLMLGFSKNGLNRTYPDWKTITVVFKDKIFGAGTIRFEFDRKQLSNMPKLKTI